MGSKVNVKCLVPGCRRERQARGLCKSHYEVAAHIVASGATSWAALEKKGKSLPTTKKPSWFRT